MVPSARAAGCQLAGSLGLIAVLLLALPVVAEENAEPVVFARIVYSLKGRRPPWPALAGALALLALGGFSLHQAVHPDWATAEEADGVVLALLENVYRSFDYRDESVIYDSLERSVTGDLLTDTYLETRRSLELENQGGARAKVTAVELRESEHTPMSGTVGFDSLLTWKVTGSVA